MMYNLQQKEVLKDDAGAKIHYNGTGNCSLFHEKFNECMTVKGFAGIISVDDYEVPRRPDDAFQRIENEVGDHRDFASTSHYTKELATHLNRCGVVHSSYKSCLSDSVSSFLKSASREEFLIPTKANYHGLKARIIRMYGGWTDKKDRNNLVKAEMIPNITRCHLPTMRSAHWTYSLKRE